MYRIELVNSTAFVRQIGEMWPRIMRTAIAAGVEKATGELAEDVAAHAPGKARDAVRERMRGQLTGVVDFDPQEAFYMRFVLLGAKAHRIAPRRSRRNRTRLAETKRNLFSALRGAGVDAARLGAFDKGLGVARLALAFTPRGGGGLLYRDSVNHPGIKARHILSSRLAAMKDRIVTTIDESVKAAFEGRSA